MISSVFIATDSGKVILYREYLGDIKRYDATAFANVVIKPQSEKLVPIKKFGFATYFIVKIGELYFIACGYGNVNATAVLHCLNETWQTMSDVFNSKITEQAVLKSTSIIYEILDLAIDGGYPQEDFKRLIPGCRRKEWKLSNLRGRSEVYSYLSDYGIVDKQGFRTKILPTAFFKAFKTNYETGISETDLEVLWTSYSLYTPQENLFVSICECVHYLFSYDGEVISNEVKGSVGLHSLLQWPTEVEITLSNHFPPAASYKTSQEHRKGLVSWYKLPYEDAGDAHILDFMLHPSVGIKAFKTAKCISTTVVDGSCILLLYRCAFNKPMPVKIQPVVSKFTRNQIHYQVTLNTLYHKRVHANPLELRIPTPKNTLSVEITQSVGKCNHVAAMDRLYWTIPRASGESTFELEFNCTLYNTSKSVPPVLPPIEVQFVLPNYSFSGLYVKRIKCPKMPCNNRNVQYTSKSGVYEHRLRYPV